MPEGGRPVSKMEPAVGFEPTKGDPTAYDAVPVGHLGKPAKRGGSYWA